MQSAAAAFVPPPYVPPPAPVATPAPQPDPAKKSARDQGGGGVKDTIESILVAFILAFVFRAFVVEAFVIPTGSMATTLLGAHTRYHCPDCGYDFTMNYQSPGNRDGDEDLNTPDYAGRIPVNVYCPNCGFLMPREATDKGPPVYYGDRILVLKYRYLLQKPRRWDVVVFKAPVKPRDASQRVVDLPPRYDTNYIKRLIGTPGEAVMVLDGDIYIRTPNDKDRDPQHFTVQPKPRDVQDAMWRLVYDNDYHPEAHLGRGYVPWTQPWKAVSGTGWDTANPAALGRAFAFDNPAGESRLEFDADANPTAQSLSDYLVHNQYYPPGQRSNVEPRDTSATRNHDIPVSDVDLRLTYARLAGVGPLTLTEVKRGHTFTAVVTPTTATLYQNLDGKQVQIGSAYPLPAGSTPIRLELANADYQVTLRVNDAEVAHSTPADFAPDLQALLAEFDAGNSPPSATVAVSAAGQRCAVSHLSLWRDVYYYNKAGGLSWATPNRFPKGAQQLGPDEYFVMGDNSQLSSDARYWTDTVSLPEEDLQADAGRVPGRFLLGKAFYVYWPAGYKAVGWLPAFVPNFGAMRFIH